jgi:hypothetical protein
MKGCRSLWSLLGRDACGAAALEFALVALPFFFVLLVILQMALYYMTQAALDAGVNSEAVALQNNFNLPGAVLPQSSAVKANIVAGAGALVFTSGTQFEIQQLSNYKTANMPIYDGNMNFTSPDTTTAILVLRAQTSVVILAPGFTSPTVEASAIIRRIGY